MILEQTVLGFPITAEMVKLDEDWDISIFGGCKTHVGAVTVSSPDGTAQTLERPGHKDSFVSARWAGELTKRLQSPVCVRCGIHYDNVTPEQIQIILEACEKLLEVAISQIAYE